jgi:tripartite-type tricarboxylate transporter receptor subunit TctC
MKTRRTLGAMARMLLASSLMLAGLTPVAAQDSTLRVIVPYPPGGASDSSARIIATELGNRLKRPVVVENRVGAGGRIAMQQMKALPADADALVFVNPSLMTLVPNLFSQPGYDAEADFQPVSQVSQYQFVLAVPTSHPARSVSALLDWIRANPDKGTIGAPGQGGIPHFFALMIGEAAKVKANVIGYKGSAPLATDLIGGHIGIAVDTLDSLAPHHQAGRLRILATSAERRILDGVPTLKESGLNLTATGWNAAYAKASMPADRVALYSREIASIMQQPEVREKFVQMKAEPVSADAARTRATVEAFKAQWVPVIRASGVRLD